MKDLKIKARKLIHDLKGDSYIFGPGCSPKIGRLAAACGKRIFLFTNLDRRDPEALGVFQKSLEDSGATVIGKTASARPNSPRPDVFRMRDALQAAGPECVLVISGGSGIDAAKAAVVLACLGGSLEDYFGSGRVTERLGASGKSLRPLLACQTASGSAAHMTKYANITDRNLRQKKLIIDEALIPPLSLFDYSLTRSMSRPFTCDGAFDALSHCLEVYYGAGPNASARLEEIVLTGIELILANLEKAVHEPESDDAREALGLAADLGGCALMSGGTNGAHLTSFSLVDVLSHGRACAILNPYYTVFFGPAIPCQVGRLQALLGKYGLLAKNEKGFGKNPAPAVARGLIKLAQNLEFPVTLGEIKGMTKGHIEKAIRAAKDPQLDSKLKSMPVPLSAGQVDEFMRPVLEAAWRGDFSLIKTLKT